VDLENFVTARQCIILTVDICVQHSGREATRRAGLSAAAETCWLWHGNCSRRSSDRHRSETAC